MTTKWYELNYVSISDSAEIEAVIVVGAGSPWFDGHFPDNPILPGIAQIGIVIDCLKHGLKRPDLAVQKLNRVRFKRLIRPETRLEVKISRSRTKTNEYIFQIMDGTEPVCSGIMKIKD